MSAAILSALGITTLITNEAAYDSLLEGSNIISEQQQGLFRKILLENSNQKKDILKLTKNNDDLTRDVGNLVIKNNNYKRLVEVINKDKITHHPKSTAQMSQFINYSDKPLDDKDISKELIKLDEENITTDQQREAKRETLRRHTRTTPASAPASVKKKGGYRIRKTHRRRR